MQKNTQDSLPKVHILDKFFIHCPALLFAQSRFPNAVSARLAGD
jgi:hypothetical protein